jgi:hypothetical protein
VIPILKEAGIIKRWQKHSASAISIDKRKEPGPGFFSKVLYR